ncbi:hypothetical protein WJX73_007028 [Symbiochloris irregularis]|uniref:Ubiquitin-like domain-containing protein n=1 Tax=Symbiochloris irregularis TaxID=706552 RepID=A0AAW1PLZ9_9CHLO
MAAKPRGYGISAQDMEASRLVFVSVKGAKPRRKIAVPVPDSYSWQDFCSQVQTKLKLSGVQSIQLASTGEAVTNIDQLQDIDELHVTEATPAAPSLAGLPTAADTNAHNAGPVDPQRLATGGAAPALANGHTPSVLNVEIAADHHSALHRHQSLRHPMLQPGATSPPAAEADGQGEDDKYVRRTSRFQRFLQSFLPASLLTKQSLPLTTRDVQPTDSKKAPGRRRRRQQSLLNMRALLSLVALLCFLAIMVLLYNRVSPRLPTVRTHR